MHYSPIFYTPLPDAHYKAAPLELCNLSGIVEVDDTIAEVAASKQKGSSATRGLVKNFYKVVQSATYRLQNLKASVQGDLKREGAGTPSEARRAGA